MRRGLRPDNPPPPRNRVLQEGRAGNETLANLRETTPYIKTYQNESTGALALAHGHRTARQASNFEFRPQNLDTAQMFTKIAWRAERQQLVPVHVQRSRVWQYVVPPRKHYLTVALRIVVPAFPVPAVYAEKSIDSTSPVPPNSSHACGARMTLHIH